MKILSHLCDHLNFDSNSDLSSPTSISSPSSASNVVSDEEVIIMLASSNPKKRAGRIKFRETRHPVFRGVRKRNSGKWVCEVREPNKKSRIWLGTYQTADMAARAHDVAALALRGRSACLNFADSTWRLPIPASSDVKDIQRAAAEAAEMFGPYQSEDLAHGDDLAADREIETNSLSGNVYGDNETKSSSENVFYADDHETESRYAGVDFPEETVFGDMPELLANMAEGLMVSPPQDCFVGNDLEIRADMSLWSYSM